MLAISVIRLIHRNDLYKQPSEDSAEKTKKDLRLLLCDVVNENLFFIAWCDRQMRIINENGSFALPVEMMRRL